MARKAAKPTNQNKEFFEAIAMLEQERGIPADYLLENVENVVVKTIRDPEQCINIVKDNRNHLK